MIKGSFEGLYTFLEVADIYGIDDSSLRKQVARGKFVIGEDVKKMGHTWIITEQAMVKSFGVLKFEDYKKKLEKKKKAEEKKINASKLKSQKAIKTTKSKGKKSSSNLDSIDSNEEYVEDSWVSGKIEGVEVESFVFNINTSK